MAEKLGTQSNVLFFPDEHTVNGREGLKYAHGVGNSRTGTAYPAITVHTKDRLVKSLYERITYLRHPPEILPIPKYEGTMAPESSESLKRRSNSSSLVLKSLRLSHAVVHKDKLSTVDSEIALLQPLGCYETV